ncbi:MAG: hypothetical protein Kow00109_13590 [Acidobacteriota bacterium]
MTAPHPTPYNEAVFLHGSIWRRWAVLTLAVLLVSAGSGRAALRVVIDGQVRRIDEREERGAVYYELRGLAAALGILYEERSGRAYLRGPRGGLELTADRPLVRRGAEYILLDAPVLRRRANDWWVPRDFLEKAVSGILDRRLAWETADRLRVEELAQVTVDVGWRAERDRLVIEFQPSQAEPAELRERGNHLEVVFPNTLVRAGSLALPEERTLIAELAFDPGEGWGVFRIAKGPGFDRYRWYRLSNPYRYVLEVFGVPQAVAAAPASPEPSEPKRSDEVPETAPPPPPIATVPRGVVMIDPGHGGQDYGVDVGAEVTEKVIVLDLARRVEEKLRARGISVELTRRRDVDLAEDQRAALANTYQARLFLSLHVGGAPTPDVRGPVVYVFRGTEVPEAEASPAGPDPSDSAGALIPWEEAQLDFAAESLQWAGMLQSSLNLLFASDNRVVPAPLAVLAPVRAPALLLEAGFLSSEDDRERLLDPDFRERLADELAGFVEEMVRR